MQYLWLRKGCYFNCHFAVSILDALLDHIETSLSLLFDKALGEGHGDIRHDGLKRAAFHLHTTKESSFFEP